MALMYYRPSKKTPTLPKGDKRLTMPFSMRSKQETATQEAHIEVFIKGEYVGYMIPEWKGAKKWYFCNDENPFGLIKAGGFNLEGTEIDGKPVLIEKIKEKYRVSQ